MSEHGQISLARKSGDEPVRAGGRDLGFGLLTFWRWSASDIVSDANQRRAWTAVWQWLPTPVLRSPYGSTGASRVGKSDRVHHESGRWVWLWWGDRHE